jgi:GNAT superfamily N-acetyltransferase
MIRLARPEDLVHLPEIERAAGAAFRDLDMASIADDEPPSMDVLGAYQRAGRAWVATDDVDRPIAYIVVDVVDQAAHVEQVSVHPDWARQGLGRRLLDAAEVWARELGLTAMTLTTFADVPWNTPYYARLGFQVVAESEWTAGQRRIRKHEAAIGLDAWPRVVMRRPITTDQYARYPIGTSARPPA